LRYEPPRFHAIISSGLIVMALGSAIDYGRAIGFGLLVSLCGGLCWKARQEERIMSRHFPDAYADYKTRVRDHPVRADTSSDRRLNDHIECVVTEVVEPAPVCSELPMTGDPSRRDSGIAIRA
jgi:hypothetical protein